MRVAVVGGGLPGLIAAYVLQRAGARVCVLERAELGDPDITEPPARTDAMVSFLNELRIPFSTWAPQIGVLMRGTIQHYPRALNGMRSEAAGRIRADILGKSGRTSTRDLSGPPVEERGFRGLRFDASEVANAIIQKVRVERVDVEDVQPNVVVDARGDRHHVDAVVWARPLWEARPRMSWYVPEVVSTVRHLVLVKPRQDTLAMWDWVWTPYTPAGAIHRVTALGGVYAAEVHGQRSLNDIRSDLQFIFPGGHALRRIVRAPHGKMFPTDEHPEWPRRVVPLGAYAQWDANVTVDVVLDRARGLASQWLGHGPG